MQTLEKTPATVLKNIKGSELPAAWRGKIKVNPARTFTITIIESEEEMPPESQISDKFIQAAKESEVDLKAGRFTDFKTTEELFAHLDQVARS